MFQPGDLPRVSLCGFPGMFVTLKPAELKKEMGLLNVAIPPYIQSAIDFACVNISPHRYSALLLVETWNLRRVVENRDE